MTYRIVKIEPCAHPKQGICVTDSEHLLQCHGCRGDGTRTVEVAVVERPQHPDHPDGELVMWDDTGETAWDAHPNASEYARPLWVEVESNAVKGPQPVPEFPHVDDEPDEEES